MTAIQCTFAEDDIRNSYLQNQYRLIVNTRMAAHDYYALVASMPAAMAAREKAQKMQEGVSSHHIFYKFWWLEKSVTIMLRQCKDKDFNKVGIALRSNNTRETLWYFADSCDSANILLLEKESPALSLDVVEETGKRVCSFIPV